MAKPTTEQVHAAINEAIPFTPGLGMDERARITRDVAAAVEALYAGEVDALPNPTVQMVRLSIPGNACVFCGTIMGDGLRCAGCGHVDPITRKPTDG